MKLSLPVRPWFGIFALTLIACFSSQSAAADIDGLGEDGWHTWRVAASEGAPDWCCFTWSAGVAQKRSCDLDGNNMSFGSSDDRMYKPVEMQLYVLMRDGEPEQIKALSPSCPVKTDKQLVDLGLIDSDSSAEWISNEIRTGYDDTDEAFAALTVHAGDAGFELLTEFVEDRSSDDEMRKKALFWLAHSDTEQAFAYIDNILTR